MPNTIDITNLSPRVLEAVLQSRNPDGFCCDHLTATECRELAVAMGWAYPSRWVTDWILGSHTTRGNQ